MEIKGYTYGYNGIRGDFRKPEAVKSQELLYDLGVNWLCLAVVNHQKAFHSTEITFDYSRTPTDRDIIFSVEKARAKGIKVCLKPMLNSADSVWRAYIKFPDENMRGVDVYWGEWFKNYSAFMLHYAELAEELGCEMLCIGCEMSGTEHKNDYWRTLIAEIRKIYSGKLTYNTNHHHEDRIEWFDALDYIGTSAYYQVGINGPEPEKMRAEWEKVRENLGALSDKTGKKYVFMEIGCRSAKGCSAIPWDFSHREYPFDEQEQADFYETCLDVFMNDSRFAGVFWWDWSTFIYDTREEALNELGFNIHLKKAEEVIKKKYAE
ncbi:MAG: glycosyl hydrolase family 53 [Oscillospiraceae bacterium]|nr:glycosyl hydrolase family 53 [Oscillospiraceae bacterium]